MKRGGEMKKSTLLDLSVKQEESSKCSERIVKIMSSLFFIYAVTLACCFESLKRCIVTAIDKEP